MFTKPPFAAPALLPLVEGSIYLSMPPTSCEQHDAAAINTAATVLGNSRSVRGLCCGCSAVCPIRPRFTQALQSTTFLQY